MKIQVSKGEIVDKFTILVIKKRNISDEEKLSNVNRELESLKPFYFLISTHLREVSQEQLIEELYAVNGELWGVEDDLRDMEKANDFSQKFIDLARSVYKLNDRRASIKKQINKITESNLTEVKSYNDPTTT
jgi:hypothetical protein